MIQFISLKAKDTFSYRDVEFSFSNGLHSISGLNGSSKTSLFLALQQCLFNKNSKCCKIEHVSNSITNQPYEIEVEFLKGADHYRVVNSRKAGRIDIYKNHGPNSIALRKIPEVLIQIKDILGCDYELFRDLTYQSKDSTLNLLDSTTNTGRAKFVNDILNLDELDGKLTQLNDKRKALEGKGGKVAQLEEVIFTLAASIAPEVAVPAELQVDTEVLDSLTEQSYKLMGSIPEITAGIKTLEDKVSEYVGQTKKLAEAAALEEELADLNMSEQDPQEVGATIDELSAEILNYKVGIAAAEAKLANANKAQTKIKRREALTAELSAIEKPDKPLEECLDQKSKIEKALATKTEQLRSAKAEHKKLEKASQIGVCPTCMTLVDPEQFNQDIIKVMDQVEELEAFIVKCNTSLVKYSDRISVWKTINEKVTEIETISGSCVYTAEDILSITTDLEKQKNLLTCAEVAKSANVTWLSLNDKRTKLRHKLEVLNAEIGNIAPPDLEELDLARFQLKEAEQSLQRINAERVEAAANVKAAELHNAECRTKRALNDAAAQSNAQVWLTLDQKKKELQEANEKVDLLKLWVSVLGPKGYRTTKIRKFLGALNQTMHRYAELMSNGRIVCKFLLSETGEITFEITDEAKTQDISLWSGGETARIKIVCLFAVLEIMEAMGSTSFNVICLDEIFSALDQEGKEGLFRVLEYLKQRNKAIYVIAHEELALDLMYDSVIKAEKLADGTTRIIQ